jgi:hypothetical protein
MMTKATSKPSRVRATITCDRCQTTVRILAGQFVCEGCPLPVKVATPTGKAVRS